jgi:hypothetical protein
VFVALAAGAVIGAVAFLFVGSKAPPPAPAPVASPVPKPVVRDVPPPPPPPPPEEVASETPPPATAEPEKKPAGKPFTPCSGECAGTATPELKSALGARAGQSRSCYERALSTNSALTGKLTIKVRVTPQGSICSANVAQDALGDPGVSRCVVQRFLTGTYPKPTGGCVDVEVPLNFVPRQ